MATYVVICVVKAKNIPSSISIEQYKRCLGEAMARLARAEAQ